MTQEPTTEYRPLCRHPQCEGDADGCRVAALAWSERDRLLAIARRRTASVAEAEDVVSEAMTRALECPDVDPSRAAAWLTAVTIRLCIDHARDRARAPKRWLYSMQTYPGTNEFEADVIDTLSAAAIAPLLDDMPEQQRRALQLRADGEPVAAIAKTMALSEKAVESLLGRARVAARTIVAGLGSCATIVAGLARRHDPGQSSAAVSTAMAFAMTTVVAANFGAPATPGQRPTATHGTGTGTAISQPALLRTPALPTVSHSRAVTTVTAHGPTRDVIRPQRDLDIGVVKMHDSGSGREDEHQSLTESLRACIKGGIEISPTYIGCRTAKP